MDTKNILIVYAHPEPRSLNGAIKDYSVETLKALGHNVKVSDLYAMGWKAQVDADDFLLEDSGDAMSIPLSSKEAYETGALTQDVIEEQQKLLWADAVIMQFPLWWYSVPAILKGWIDRVYAFGFGYGVGEHSERKWGERFGEGKLAGKRAMLVVTVGGWPEHYSQRGINGSIDDVLWPINHGVLFYPGFEVLPSFVAFKVMGMDTQKFTELCDNLKKRLTDLFNDEPIAYRAQNGGDYTVPELTLQDGIAPASSGFGIHQK